MRCGREQRKQTVEQSQAGFPSFAFQRTHSSAHTGNLHTGEQGVKMTGERFRKSADALCLQGRQCELMKKRAVKATQQRGAPPLLRKCFKFWTQDGSASLTKASRWRQQKGSPTPSLWCQLRTVALFCNQEGIAEARWGPGASGFLNNQQIQSESQPGGRKSVIKVRVSTWRLLPK